jgi:hypothetical protein
MVYCQVIRGQAQDRKGKMKMKKEMQIKNISLIQRNGRPIGLSIFIGEMSRESIAKLDPMLGKEITDINQVNFSKVGDKVVQKIRVCNIIEGKQRGIPYLVGDGLQHRNVMRFDALCEMVVIQVKKDISSRLRILKSHKETDILPKWIGDTKSQAEIQAELDSVKTGPVMPIVRPINIPGKSVKYRLVSQFEMDSAGEIVCNFIRVPVIDGVSYVKKVRVKKSKIQEFENPFKNIPGDTIRAIVPFGNEVEEEKPIPPVYKLVEMAEEEIRDRVLAKKLDISVSELHGKDKKKKKQVVSF